MGYLAAILVSSIATVLCIIANPYFDHSNLIMIYLLAIVYIATNFGRGPSILASIMSVAAFDYFCVLPHYSLAVSDWQFLITFAVMLVVAVLISTLSSEAQKQSESDKARERRSDALRALSSELSLKRGSEELVETSLRHIRTYFDATVGIYLPDSSGNLCEYTADKGLLKIERPKNEIAQHVFEHKEICGLGKGSYAETGSLFVPLLASQEALGVLQISPHSQNRLVLSEDFDLLDSFAKHMALCLEVASLAEQAQNSALQVEREQLRNILLSSVSHDLRTPLATITGASSSLLEDNALSEQEKHELAEVILEEAENLNALVRNLLEMTRLEAGAASIKKNWHSLEELIGTALARLERHFQDRRIHISLPEDLPLLNIDEILMQQVVLNLLENALKYTPAASEIEIKAEHDTNSTPPQLKLLVLDRGPGIAKGEEEEIFTKFYRCAGANKHLGVGLGLSICKAIVKEHGGKISAANREGGGAQFEIRLPIETAPPVSEPASSG